MSSGNKAIDPRRTIDRPHLLRSSFILFSVLTGMLASFLRSDLSVLLMTGLVALGCYVVVAKSSTGSPFLPSPPLLFVLIFCLMIDIGTGILVSTSGSRDFTAVFSLNVGIVMFALGVILANGVLHFRPSTETREYLQRPVSLPRNEWPYLLAILGIALPAIAIIYHLFFQGSLPILSSLGQLFRGTLSPESLKQQRLSLTYWTIGGYRGQGYLEQFRQVILPFLALLSLVIALTRSSRGWRYMSLCLGGLSVLLLAGTGQRHTVAAFGLKVVLVIFYIVSARQRMRIITFIVGVGLCIYVLQTLLLGRFVMTGDLKTDLARSTRTGLERVVLANARSTSLVFQFFPEPEPFRRGMTWINDLLALLPGPDESFSAEFYRIAYGKVGSAAPMSFSEMYANFGVAGVIVGSLLLGFIQQTFHIEFMRMSKSAMKVTIYAFLGGGLALQGLGGLLTPVQQGLISIPLLWWLVRLLSSFLSLGRNRAKADLDQEERRVR